MEARSGVMPCHIRAGDVFAGKYLVERVLGSGGMSVVIAAVHQGLRQKVAIKLVSAPNEAPSDDVSRFLREARVAAALHSEHAARVVDFDIDARGRHFIVMEYLDGHNLHDVLQRGPELPIETAVGYLLHACEAMAEAHSLGIIHRDLKPQNLFLTRRIDGAPLVKVLDFGVSKIVAPRPADAPISLITLDVLLGTPHYMAPEQIRTPGEIDARTDVWAMGVTLFELLTREEPFTGDTVPDIIAAVLQNAPRSPAALRADIPPALARVVLACLEKDVSRRIPNAGVLARALRPWAPAWAADAAERAERICSTGSPASAAMDGSAAMGGKASHAAESEVRVVRPRAVPGRSPRATARRERRFVRLLYVAAAAALGVGGLLLGSGSMKPPGSTTGNRERGPSEPAHSESVANSSVIGAARPIDAVPAVIPPATVIPAATALPPLTLPSAAIPRQSAASLGARGGEGPRARSARAASAARAPAKPAASVRVTEPSEHPPASDPLAERL